MIKGVMEGVVSVLNGYREHHKEIESDGVKGYSRTFLVKSDLLIHMEEILVTEPLLIEYPHPSESMIAILLNLSGEHTFGHKKEGNHLARVDTGYIYAVKGPVQVSHIPMRLNRIFGLYMSYEFLESSARQLDSEFWSNIVEKIKNSETPRILHEFALTAYMKDRIEQIWNCPLKNELRRVFIQSAILDIIFGMIKENETELSEDTGESVRECEKRKLEQARRVIEEKLQNPPSIPELARLVDLNTYKLKKYFKIVYGETIYKYVRKLKMEKARFLILETNSSIHRIALEIGYSNPSQFSRTFRMHFQCNPNELRKASGCAPGSNFTCALVGS